MPLGMPFGDDSGEGSVNLLTSDYIGNFSYYDLAKEKLFNMPTIKVKIYFKVINLEYFSKETYFEFDEKSTELDQEYTLRNR